MRMNGGIVASFLAAYDHTEVGLELLMLPVRVERCVQIVIRTPLEFKHQSVV
jgi:hypothetical protein